MVLAAQACFGSCAFVLCLGDLVDLGGVDCVGLGWLW